MRAIAVVSSIIPQNTFLYTNTAGIHVGLAYRGVQHVPDPRMLAWAGSVFSSSRLWPDGKSRFHC
jgi:hypothetical protein